MTVTTKQLRAGDEVSHEPDCEHADGIYFGLPDAEYHADPALGSTGLKRILRSAPDFWWHSPMNPLRPDDKDTEAKVFGRAVHRFVLEGAERFRAGYAPTDHPGNTKEGKAERAEIAAAGKTPLKREAFERILVSGQMIRMNPELAAAFEGGMPEVSVFWERDGVRLKARFDYLKVRAISDLKSIRNTLEVDFVDACRKRFANSRFDMQARHYMDGRLEMPALAAAGRVFGDHDPAWLARVLAAETFAFVYVFWQAEDSPITWACSLSLGNPVLDIGRAGIDLAISRYREFRDRFGTNQAWVLQEPVAELDLNDLPPWWGRSAA